MAIWFRNSYWIALDVLFVVWWSQLAWGHMEITPCTQYLQQHNWCFQWDIIFLFALSFGISLIFSYPSFHCSTKFFWLFMAIFRDYFSEYWFDISTCVWVFWKNLVSSSTTCTMLYKRDYKGSTTTFLFQACGCNCTEHDSSMWLSM